MRDYYNKQYYIIEDINLSYVCYCTPQTSLFTKRREKKLIHSVP